MIRVACLSYFLPKLGNEAGPTGLLYQLLFYRSSNICVDLFCFCEPDMEYKSYTEKKLGIEIFFVGKNKKKSRAPFWWPRGAKNIIEYKFPELKGYDVVWGYPYWFAPFIDKSSTHLISGMDSASLLYMRKLLTEMRENRGFPLLSLVGNLLFEFWYLRKKNVHVVGKKDAFYLKLIGVNSKYLAHPYFEDYSTIHERKSSKIVILMSNLGSPFYGSLRYRYWIKALCKINRNNYTVEILLHKASETTRLDIIDLVKSTNGVSVESCAWVDDYSLFLSNVDIQWFPLDIGAGTKTSVLTALKSNIICLGTEVAFENIESNENMYSLSTNSSDIVKSKIEFLLERAILRKNDITSVAPVLESHQPLNGALCFWDYVCEINHQKK